MTASTRFLVPLGLALAAGGANYAILKRQITKVEVVVVTADIAEGDVITQDKLGKIVIRADAKLFPNACKPENLGEVEGQTARRSLRAGEILFRADVEESLLPPNPGEQTWSVNVRVERVTPHLIPGQSVVLKVLAPDTASAEPRKEIIVGPYRFLGWQKYRGPEIKEPARQYVFAVPAQSDPAEVQARGHVDAHRHPLEGVLRIERATAAAPRTTTPRP